MSFGCAAGGISYIYLFKHFLEHLTGKRVYMHFFNSPFSVFMSNCDLPLKLKMSVPIQNGRSKMIETNKTIFAQYKISQKYHQELEELAKIMFYECKMIQSQLLQH